MALGRMLSRPTLTDAPIPEDDLDMPPKHWRGPSQTRPRNRVPKHVFVTAGSDESAMCPRARAKSRHEVRPLCWHLLDVRPSSATRSGNKPHRGKRPTVRNPLPCLVQTGRSVSKDVGIRIRDPRGTVGTCPARV